jgi:hypothetical protein
MKIMLTMPYSPWHNRAESSIHELKKATICLMWKHNALQRTWHYTMPITPCVPCFTVDWWPPLVRSVSVVTWWWISHLLLSSLICDNCQRLIDERIICSNACRHSYDYQPGQEVLKQVYKPDKLEPCAHGPYDIIVVHSNGTLTIQLNAHTTERISIRNVKPFCEIELSGFILIRFPLPIPWLNTCVIVSTTLRRRMCCNTQSCSSHKNDDSHSFPAQGINPLFRIDPRSDPFKISIGSKTVSFAEQPFQSFDLFQWTISPHVPVVLRINKQVNLSLTNKSINYSLTDQCIKLAFNNCHRISRQSNWSEQSGRSHYEIFHQQKGRQQDQM